MSTIVTASSLISGCAPGSDESRETFIKPDDTRIVYEGRVDLSDPVRPAFGFPGVEIRASFEGPSVAFQLSDSGEQDYFNVAIDDKAPAVVRTLAGSARYDVASNLGEGSHTISIFKRTESLCGVATFEGFILSKGRRLLALPALPQKKIEFIGDSITCGYGDMVSTDHPENFPFTPANENNAIAWGALCARSFGARYMATAYSGRGLFRNYDGTENGTLPQMYGSIFADEPQRAAWDAKRYQPDVIVINLGTNDYGSAVNRDDVDALSFDARFASEYKAFLARLRELHGNAAQILCVVGPMINDGFPTGKKSWTRIQAVVSGLVDDLNKAGDKGVHFLALHQQNPPFGEDWHPSAATQADMASQVIARLAGITGWQATTR